MRKLANKQYKLLRILLGIVLFNLFTVSSVTAQFTWVGTTSDINTATNWNPVGVPASGNTCTFDNTGINTNITGNPAPGVLIVVSSTGAKNYTINGILSGSTTITKNGSSRLTLMGANTYSGITNVNGGTLNIQNNSALGSSVRGTVVRIFAKLQIQNNITVNGEALSLNWLSSGALENVSGNNRWNGNVTLTDNCAITTTAGTLNISGVISGPWGLSKYGNGTLTLPSANTYTGGTSLFLGTLNINHASALGDSTGAFRIFGGIIDNTSGSAITTVNYPNGWGGDFTFKGTNNLNLGKGAVILDASRNITIIAKTLTVGGIIDDDEMNITKLGAGILEFVDQRLTINSLIVSAGTLTSTSDTLNIAGDFINNSIFNNNNGTVSMIGYVSGQCMAGSAITTFNNLTLNNISGISPQISLVHNDLTVEGTLSMYSSNNVNLNSRTLTLGKGPANPGTLKYTSGLLYEGTFRRWMSPPIMPITDARGYFPMGTSVLDKRPLWVGYSAPLITGGTVSVSHTPVYPSSYNNGVFLDPTWGSGTYLDGISNSSWTISTENGLILDGNTGLLKFGGTGFGVNNLSALNATLDTICIGTFAAATNNIVPLEVNRTDLSETDIANRWFIGSSDIGSSPLPIELLNFEAAYMEETGFVELKWSTATEINNDFFTVESSKDGSTWAEILIKDGAGTTHQFMSYIDFDKHPYDGINYYRLKQTDYNGDYTYSKIIAINIHSSIDNKVIAFPSPVNDILNISSPGISFEEIFVLDSKGAIVAHQLNPDLSENTKIDFGRFKNGNYLIKLKTKNTIATKKITVVHR
jgi:autotransporter-associated beta strand protein